MSDTSEQNKNKQDTASVQVQELNKLSKIRLPQFSATIATVIIVISVIIIIILNTIVTLENFTTLRISNCTLQLEQFVNSSITKVFAELQRDSVLADEVIELVNKNKNDANGKFADELIEFANKNKNDANRKFADELIELANKNKNLNEKLIMIVYLQEKNPKSKLAKCIKRLYGDNFLKDSE